MSAALQSLDHNILINAIHNQQLIYLQHQKQTHLVNNCRILYLSRPFFPCCHEEATPTTSISLDFSSRDRSVCTCASSLYSIYLIPDKLYQLIIISSWSLLHQPDLSCCVRWMLARVTCWDWSGSATCAASIRTTRLRVTLHTRPN